ncbi:MAG: hypothetical protein SFZ24_00630 [Planctomycetota bacterium]|nr:hypothetical protein [Planctomycetota bacterium]
MPPSALLRHQTPDGSSHLDWLIARTSSPAGPDDRCLIALRIRERPDTPLVLELDAERLPDHRWLYLTHEGPLPGPNDRGAVTRLATFESNILSDRPDRLDIAIGTPLGWTNWYGRPHPGRAASPQGHPLWTFEAVRG